MICLKTAGKNTAQRLVLARDRTRNPPWSRVAQEERADVKDGWDTAWGGRDAASGTG